MIAPGDSSRASSTFGTRDGRKGLAYYPAGSWGPEAADKLLRSDQCVVAGALSLPKRWRRWRDIRIWQNDHGSTLICAFRPRCANGKWLGERARTSNQSVGASRGRPGEHGQGSDSDGERVVILGANGVMGVGAAETFRGRRLSCRDAGAGAGQSRRRTGRGPEYWRAPKRSATRSRSATMQSDLQRAVSGAAIIFEALVEDLS